MKATSAPNVMASPMRAHAGQEIAAIGRAINSATAENRRFVQDARHLRAPVNRRPNREFHADRRSHGHLNVRIQETTSWSVA